MALLYEITRRASSAMTRHIQVCSRMAIMQHDLLCVAYSGTPCWNIRCKSNALTGKGKRKDKAHYLSLRHSVGPRAAAIYEVAVNAPAGSRSFTKQTASPPGISKSPSASSLKAAQEKIHPKTNPKPLDDLRKDIQASFSGEFKSKFSDKTKMNAHDNDRSDFITKYSDHVTKDQMTCSNAKLDPVVKSPKLEVKHSPTSKLATGDPTNGSGTGVMSKNKEIEGNNTIKLSDRYVLVPASEWAKVRQAIFSREFPQSRGETIKTQDRATPTGDTKDKPSRTAAEPSVCHANMAQKVYKSDDVLAVKQSESSRLATQSSQPTTASSMKRNIVLGDGEKGVSNIFDGTTSSTLDSLVVDKVPSKRYASENEAGRSKSDTSVGPATKPNKIDPPGCGKVVVTKSASSLPLQPQMRPSASREAKPQRQGTADEICKLDKAKATVDSAPTKVKSFDGAAVETVDPQELQRSFQLQKKLMESYERDLIKYELALKKYKAMLSLAEKINLIKYEFALMKYDAMLSLAIFSCIMCLCLLAQWAVFFELINNEQNECKKWRDINFQENSH